MMVFKFYPDNKSKFHFGDSNNKLKEVFSSDQLFSALYNCAVLLYGSNEKQNKLLERLQRLSFSSLFWGLFFKNSSNGKSKELLFLPRPLAPISSREGSKSLLNNKKTKKIKYLSMEAFRLLQETWQKEDEFFDFNLLDLQILGSSFACTKEEAGSLDLDSSGLEKIKFFNLAVIPKVVISRIKDKSENLYYQDELEIAYQQIGNYLIKPFFYFICQGEMDDRLSVALRLMADEGIGGKRSHGMGILALVYYGLCKK